jgi:hypothetical protein
MDYQWKVIPRVNTKRKKRPRPIYKIIRIMTYLDQQIGKIEQLETPKHYDNSKGTLYKVATERGWNSYLFDIVKRLERAEKKGEFKTDLEKSINVIKLWLQENGN